MVYIQKFGKTLCSSLQRGNHYVNSDWFIPVMYPREFCTWSEFMFMAHRSPAKMLQIHPNLLLSINKSFISYIHNNQSCVSHCALVTSNVFPIAKIGGHFLSTSICQFKSNMSCWNTILLGVPINYTTGNRSCHWSWFKKYDNQRGP